MAGRTIISGMKVSARSDRRSLEGRVSVSPSPEFRSILAARAEEVGLKEGTSLARAIMILAEEGLRARLRRAEERAMEGLYEAWADDPERAAANEAAFQLAVESEIF